MERIPVVLPGMRKALTVFLPRLPQEPSLSNFVSLLVGSVHLPDPLPPSILLLSMKCAYFFLIQLRVRLSIGIGPWHSFSFKRSRKSQILPFPEPWQGA